MTTYRIPAPQSPAGQSPAGQSPAGQGPQAPRARQPTGSRPAAKAVYVRRRIAVIVGVVLLALVLVLTSDAIMAEAGGASPITGGHVVVEPGQTLWDIAQANAPAGMDLRAYLLDIEQLNGVRADRVAAWDVILLPVAR